MKTSLISSTASRVHRQSASIHPWFEWAVAFFSTWFVVGLYLDGWAHTHQLPDTLLYALARDHLQRGAGRCARAGRHSLRGLSPGCAMAQGPAGRLRALVAWGWPVPDHGRCGLRLAFALWHRGRSGGALQSAASRAGRRRRVDRQRPATGGLVSAPGEPDESLARRALAHAAAGDLQLLHQRVASV